MQQAYGRDPIGDWCQDRPCWRGQAPIFRTGERLFRNARGIPNDGVGHCISQLCHNADEELLNRIRQTVLTWLIQLSEFVLHLIPSYLLQSHKLGVSEWTKTMETLNEGMSPCTKPYIHMKSHSLCSPRPQKDAWFSFEATATLAGYQHRDQTIYRFVTMVY
jgi:hypothetical protein